MRPLPRLSSSLSCPPHYPTPPSHAVGLQIFLTLLSSLALRAAEPSVIVGNLVSVILVLVPLIGVALETPLLDELGVASRKLSAWFAKRFPKLQPPTTLDVDLSEAEPEVGRPGVSAEALSA